MNNRFFSNALLCIATLAETVGLSARTASADLVCVPNPGDPTNCICVDWTLQDDPEPLFDFVVDFTDPANPNIELRTGDTTWTVFSEGEAGTGNIGSLTIDPTVSTADFDVIIQSSTNPGAVNVGGIILSAPSWSGHSSLVGGRILGDLTNSLVVVEDSSNEGGAVAFEIDGDLSGDATIPKVLSMTVGGDVSADVAIAEVSPAGVLTIEGDITSTGFLDIGELKQSSEGPATVNILGDVAGDIEVGIIRTAAFLNINGDLTGDVSITDRLESGQLHVFGDVGVASCVTIQNIVGGVSMHSHARFNFDNEPGRTFAGDLVFVNGIPTDQHVEVYGAITSTGSVSLNGHDMDGQLFFYEGGSGTILNIDDVAGKLTLTIEPDKTFSGTLTLASQSGGEIELLDGGNLAGTITVTGNMSASEEGDGMLVDGDINSAGRIEVNGDLSGNMFVNESCSGTIDVGQTLTGSVSIGGALQGDIETGSHLTGSIDVAGEMTYTASLTVAGSLNGDLSFGQSVDGTIHALTELGSSGSISIVKKLKARGRILVDDLCYGAISVGEDTVDLSLIHVIDGIASTGSITVNDGAGAFNADGDIRVGTTNVTPPLDPVTFDGSILIKKQSGGTGGGDLGGSIRVIGCHATADALDICLCGGDGGSNITLFQTGCGATQADGWSCVSGCP